MFLKYSLRFTTFTSFISLINQLLPLPRILFSVLRLDILHRIAVRAVEFHGLRVEDISKTYKIKTISNARLYAISVWSRAFIQSIFDIRLN